MKKNVKKVLQIWNLYVISPYQIETTMTKEQILDLIRSQEAEMYQDLLYMRERFGADDKATRYAAAQWAAINNLLDTIEDEENH